MIIVPLEVYNRLLLVLKGIPSISLVIIRLIAKFINNVLSHFIFGEVKSPEVEAFRVVKQYFIVDCLSRYIAHQVIVLCNGVK